MPTANFTDEDLIASIKHLTGFAPNVIIKKSINDKGEVEVAFR